MAPTETMKMTGEPTSRSKWFAMAEDFQANSLYESKNSGFWVIKLKDLNEHNLQQQQRARELSISYSCSPVSNKYASDLFQSNVSLVGRARQLLLWSIVVIPFLIKI